ncbi:MAG: hypothetical protein QXD86_06450 [Candidatus Bathyarchaeia archaeon]
MKISINKKGIDCRVLNEFDRILRDLLYIVSAENEDVTVYEGVFSIELPADALKLNLRSFKKFCDSLTVENGKLKRLGTVLIIEPYRRRVIRIKLTEDEFQALCECARLRGKKLREFFRGAMLSAILARRG